MKRRVAFILALLALGVLLNIAVAWLIADVAGPDFGEAAFVVGPSPTDSWVVMTTRGLGHLDVAAMISSRSSGAVHVTDDRVPTWSRIRHLPPYQEGDPMPFMHDLAFGWPALSMWCSVDGTRAWDSGTVTSRQASGATPGLDYPLRVLWVGFASNSVFYAALVALLFLGPRGLRRRWRKLHGRCPTCGYPLGGSERCSECGAHV
jgi:hypothetical protein